MEVKSEIFTRDKFWEPISQICIDEVFNEKRSNKSQDKTVGEHYYLVIEGGRGGIKSEKKQSERQEEN